MAKSVNRAKGGSAQKRVTILEMERRIWRIARKKMFFYLTVPRIFSNQPADFLKQLKNLEMRGVLERFSMSRCQSYKC